MGALTAYWLGLAVLWGALTTVILPRLVEQAVPPAVKTTALALITGLQAVIAIVVQPVSGAASDRLSSRWGRRRPLLAVGVAVQLVCLGLLAMATGYWAVLGAMLLVECWSDVAQGPYQGLLPDLVPAGQRSLESGLMGGATLAGQVVGVAAAGVAVAAGQTQLAIVLCGLVLGLTTLVTLLGVSERAGRLVSGAEPGSGPLGAAGWLRHLLHLAHWAGPLRQVVVEVWDRDVLERRDYVWLLAARLLILMATGTLQPFVYFYLEDSLGLGGQAAVAVAPLAGTVALVALVSAVVTVSLSTRLGLVRTISLSAISGAVGAALFAVAPSYALLFVIALPFGLALGVFLSADWALLVDVVPLDEAGRYLGLSNTVTAAAGLLAVALGGPLADLINGWRFGWGYRAVFVLAALEFALGALCMRRVHEPEATPATPVGPG
ncbi:MAG TPA: MFS transporter [Candidatus Limnocylindrales bacterium]|nr:MFS transporter [Candidatus Limnocylindrales bacterium]